jgi:hypothetical protein
MKIIFLDIDGVLNSINYYVSLFKIDVLPDDRLDPHSIDLFNKIIDCTGASIVLSSTWRLGKSVSEIQDIFDKHHIHGHVIGLTPDTDKARGYQIQQWIDESNIIIDSFIIIDDDSDMYHLTNHLIKTSIKEGLTEDSVRAAIGAFAPII